jgi:hypothetical protein
MNSYAIIVKGEIAHLSLTADGGEILMELNPNNTQTLITLLRSVLELMGDTVESK